MRSATADAMHKLASAFAFALALTFAASVPGHGAVLSFDVIGPNRGSSDFATEVYDVLQNVSGQICPVGGCRAVMRYVRFGRPPVIIK